jgi:hypothetical protein
VRAGRKRGPAGVSGKTRRYIEAGMKRLLILWLTLLGSFWLTRAVVSALLFERVDRGAEAVVPLLVIPLLQTLVVGWVTRPAGGRMSGDSSGGGEGG